MAYIRKFDGFASKKINESTGRTNERFIQTSEEYRRLGRRLKDECEMYLSRICSENNGNYDFYAHGIEGLCITNDKTNSALSEIYDMHFDSNGKLVFNVEGTDEYPIGDIVSVGELASVAEEIYEAETR